MNLKVPVLSFLVLTILAFPGVASAYIGPGAGISAIGAVLALLAAVFLAIVGLVWYPAKRLMRRRKASGATKSTPEDDVSKG
ncbi:MAG: hypothetical protein R3360_06840 [Alphaproteobacteria bacterium]|nr:hypothetical protein [Alphaproteobacteria bacterium]